MPPEDTFGDDLEGGSFLKFSDASTSGKSNLKSSIKDRPRSPPANGQGKVTYPNGDMYEGSYEGGMRHGKGIMKFADGRQYRGKWRLDLPHGPGEEVRADRTSYKGEYYQGLWNGHGVEISVYGDEYNGEWRQGERHGKGDYFSDGLHYEGEWRKGCRHGSGKCVFRNGDMYDGDFQGDLMHGEGTMILANGCHYAGSWANGKMEGRGKMLFPTGDAYEGEWLSGRKHGTGRYTSANGSVYQGEFENGKRHGTGTQHSAVAPPSQYKTAFLPYRVIEGEVYAGEWKFGKRCGLGTITAKEQVVYDGEFLNDSRDGMGTGHFKNGSSYTGAWKMGKMHGKGCLSSKGQAVQGIWEEGVCKQTIDSDFETLKNLEMGEDGDTMAAFEKGRNRLLVGGVAEGALATGLDDDNQDWDDRGLESPHDLHDIEEGDEGMLSSLSPEVGVEGNNSPYSHQVSAQEQKLPDIQNAHNSRRTAQSAAAVHDEQVHLSGRYGVPMRGTFDMEGRYIPPVSTDTLREWNLVNSTFTQAKGARKQAHRGAAGGLSAAESVYTFEPHLRPGYGEGRSAKEARSHMPRKTQALEAGPGEFSFKRWRQERLL